VNRPRKLSIEEIISNNSALLYHGIIPDRRGKPVKHNPDKGQLWATIVICAQLGRPLPPWAAQVIFGAYGRWRSGSLKSWNDVLGKPFPGERRAGAITLSRKPEVLREIDRLRKSGLPLGPNLFEEAGRNTGIGSKTTVSNLYYGKRPRKR
jgi:hypothetical protein